jgi:NAD(P)-dependent dehydrogenase (short-subunit alcohol dehydrogenase family)
MASVTLTKAASFRLDGKRALVTGGGRGIGLAAASALAAAGAHVTLAARTKAEIEDAASAIRARGEKADALVLDVTDVEPICPTSRSRISMRSLRSTCAPRSSWRRRWRCG